MISNTKSLLVEIGCEELPPNALVELSTAFAKGIGEGLAKRGIAADLAGAKVYNSPRRLAVLVPDVAMMQPAQNSEMLGPYLNIGLDANGAPTPALRGFAAKNGVAVEQLQRLTDAKGERFVARNEKPGQPTATLMQEILIEALKSLPIPKPMRWGDHDYTFVRPVHWLVILHGDQVIDAEIFGIRSGRESRGHRFHHPQPVVLADADAYYEALYAAKVMVSPDERKSTIRDNCRAIALANNVDLFLHASASLMEELVNLTEWPVPVLCRFDDAYLKIPHEALRVTMEVNQRFIATELRQPLTTQLTAQEKTKLGIAATTVSNFSGLSSWFFGVANIESKDPTEVRKGYERVIRPRFADAKFFYDEDRETPLATHQEGLKSVTYQQQLGSVWDKCVRVAELARVIANRLGVDAAQVTRAASLCKCDLLTRMVGEFPELQGVMGRYYAQADGEPDAVAQALDEFYRPRFAGDAIAQGKVAQVLAVAERLDTLAGIFGVGQKPSGNKDPFALRRAALGLARTLIEGKLDLDFEAVLREAVELLPEIRPSKFAKDAAPTNSKQTLVDALRDFIYERLRGYYAEQGFGADQFDCVLAVEPESLLDFDRRLRAVAEFAKLPEAAALAAANKRIGNILRQAGDGAGGRVDAALLDAGAERELHKCIETTLTAIEPLRMQSHYVEILRTLAALRAPVDCYFDKVMVMVDDAAKRNNRLVLLGGLRRMFLHVADISLLQQA